MIAGDFEVVRPLGEGGMGAVYVTLQRSTGKARALKVMHPALVADAGLRARFEREARVAAKVDSPHVVDVIAAGVDASTGTPWIAMELLLGEDLGARLARGALPREEAAEVVRQVGHCLAAAHRVGVVHRDLKPENIFLDASRLRPGEAFRVKVLDFGVALLREAAPPGSVTQAVGSPLWMAPEQTESGDRVGPASDVWALGLVAFTMLTGRTFWRAGNDPASTLQALLREVLFEPIPRASERARRYGLAPLPEGFDAWFARTVARDPEARFRDVAAAVAAYDAMGGGAAKAIAPAVPTTLVWTPSEVAPTRVPGAAPLVTAPPARRAVPSPRGWIAVGALALVALIGGGLASARATRPPRSTTTRSPAPQPVVTTPPPALDEDTAPPGTRPPTAMRAMDLPTRAVPVALPPEPRPAPSRAPSSASPTGGAAARARALEALQRALQQVGTEEEKQNILRQIEALRGR